MYLIWNLEHMFLSLRKAHKERKTRPNPTLSLLSTHTHMYSYLSSFPSLYLSLSLGPRRPSQTLSSFSCTSSYLSLSLCAYVSLNSFEFFSSLSPSHFFCFFSSTGILSLDFLLHGCMHQAHPSPLLPPTHTHHKLSLKIVTTPLILRLTRAACKLQNTKRHFLHHHLLVVVAVSYVRTSWITTTAEGVGSVKLSF